MHIEVRKQAWNPLGKHRLSDAWRTVEQHVVSTRGTVSAVSPQLKGGKTYNFISWSDGGAQTHNITAPSTAKTYTARFK